MNMDEAEHRWAVKKARIMGEFETWDREQKVAQIKATAKYRSGTDSINTVYMGSIATAGLIHALGGRYGHAPDLDELLEKATDQQLNLAFQACASVWSYMQDNPTTTCPCCGQIIPVKKK